MRTGFATALGLGVGAGLMYWWDPARGRRRRARLGQKLRHEAHAISGEAEKGARDLAHRTQGVAARTRAWWQRRSPPDATVVESVRAKLGRVCSHAGAIAVTAQDGRVRLAGPILQHELIAVLDTVARVPGVREVENQLEAHGEAGQVSGLQEGSQEGSVRRLRWVDRLQTPAARLLAGSAGAALLGYAAKRRRPLRGLTGVLGASLLARSAANRPWTEILGVGGKRWALDVHKAIHVNAPVDDVFAFWSELESFPRFMSHVQQVRRTGDNRYQWKVTGLAGAAFDWEAEITELVPNRVLAWRSVPGPHTHLESAGVVRFQPSDAGTQVDIRLSYRPPGGLLGHGVATLLGRDPKKQMDDDLLRFKTLIEKGKATGHETVTRDDIVPHKPT